LQFGQYQKKDKKTQFRTESMTTCISIKREMDARFKVM
jgi:hypothetical protein